MPYSILPFSPSRVLKRAGSALRYRLRSRREYARLDALPRYQPTTTAVLGTPLDLPDARSFLEMHYDIFERESYRFETEEAEPYIIDGGANIGLSVLYFKALHPRSRVVAFEPDPAIFAYLERNVRRSGAERVALVPKALAAAEARRAFVEEGSYGSRLARPGGAENSAVETVRLRPYLYSRVALLKLDIEGAEAEVLADCADLLPNVERVALEYHSFADEPQTLHVILSVLAEAGFRVHVNEVRTAPQPLVHRDVIAGMDLQLLVTAFRP
ncbi:MAG: FkbM family methyltransferase [Rhodothermales bacterium]|nr:FkbM family methyltransferase [Rhodothermales bacterium]